MERRLETRFEALPPWELGAETAAVELVQADVVNV
jgi:hypothetical protein